ncbi:hypothetical protein TNCV_3724811 [Trichonephila clavipes]|nr:hypothetical protein TNCV_3724811 [Trichonephila clavipes]
MLPDRRSPDQGARNSSQQRAKGHPSLDVALSTIQVAAIRDFSRSCLDLNDFTVLNCIAKGQASLSPPSLRLRLCSRFTLLAT